MSDEAHQKLKEWAPTLTWIVGLLIILVVIAAQWGFYAAAGTVGVLFTIAGVAADLFGDF